MSSEGFTPSENSGEHEKAFSVFLLSETQIQEIERKLNSATSLKSLADIASILGLKVFSVDDINDQIVLEGENGESSTIRESFSTSQYITFIEGALEQSRLEARTGKTQEPSEEKEGGRENLGKEQKLTPHQRLQKFIEEEVLKDIPENEKLAHTFIPQKTITALRHFGGEYSNAIAYVNEKHERVIRIGYPGLERTLSHEEAVEVLRTYLKEGKKPSLPRIPKEKLPAFIEDLFRRLPEEGNVEEDRSIPDETMSAFRSLGREFVGAIRERNKEGVRGIRYGYKGKEKFITHNEAVRLLRNYAKRERSKEEKMAEGIKDAKVEFAEAIHKNFPEFDENSSISDLPYHFPNITGAPDSMAVDLLENEEEQKAERKDTVRQPEGTPESLRAAHEVDESGVVNLYDLSGRLNDAQKEVANLAYEATISGDIPSDIPIVQEETGPRVSSREVEDAWSALRQEYATPTPAAAQQELPEDVQKAMDDVREQTREQLKRINRVETDDVGYGSLRGGNKSHEEKIDEANIKYEAKEKDLTKDLTYDARFSTEFGITKEDLASIDGFDRLSVPQQKLLFENLKEYKDRGADGYVGAVWSGIKSAFGNKGDGVPRKGSKGMEAYGDTLKILVHSAEKFGPKVHEEEDGKLYADFVGMQFDREHRSEQKQVVDDLNMAAHAFARTPASWQEDGNGVHAKDEWKVTTFLKEKVFRTDSRKHYREYELRQQQFDEAKTNFAAKLEATGVPRGEIVKKLIEIDAQVYKLRFVETDPEAAALLERAPESTFKKIGSLMAQGALYSGIGAVGRIATAHVLNFAASPAVAASLAGVRSWNRTAAEQRERDRKAHMGLETDTRFQSLLQKTKDAYKKDPKGQEYIEATEALRAYQEKNTALNIVSASQTVEISGEKRDVGLTQKLQDSINEYKSAYPDLMEKLENAKAKRDDEAISHYQEQLDKKLESLKARATYSYDKLKLNRIQFGDKDTFAKNQAKFFETLAAAQIVLAEQDPNIAKSGVALEARLASFLDVREGAINDRRHSEQLKKVAIAASTAAALALAGALAVEEYKTGGVSEKLKEWFGRSTASFSPSEGLLDAELGGRNTTVPFNSSEGTTPQASVIEQAKAPVQPAESIKETYSIKKGDTLTKIVQRELPLKSPDGKPLSENAVFRLLKQLTPAELEKIGVKGGKIDRIYAGKNLNLVELNKALLAHPAELKAENVGDFKGAAFEIDSDVLNKASVIKEMEVTIPDISNMPNEYPSGGEVSAETQKPTEVVDLITQKKAEILQHKFIELHLNKDVWEGIMKNELAKGYTKLPAKEAINIIDAQIESITKLFVAVEKEPFKMKPASSETVEKYMKRIFVEVAKRSTDGDYPREIRLLMNRPHRSGFIA